MCSDSSVGIISLSPSRTADGNNVHVGQEMVLPLPPCQIQERFVFFYPTRPSADGRTGEKERKKERRRKTRYEIRVGTMKKTLVRYVGQRKRAKVHIWFSGGHLIKKEKRKNNERNPSDLERLSKMTVLLCVQQKRFNELFMNSSAYNPAIIFV